MNGVDQMALSDDKKRANAMCFPAAVEQLESSFTLRGRRAPALDVPAQRIQVALAETTSGRIEADTSAALRAREYIDRCLELGRPVLVGVSTVSLAADRHNEGITEHFVTVSGRGVDDAGRAFYEFRDPGAGGGRGYAKDFLYEVSQVRAYADLSVDS